MGSLNPEAQEVLETIRDLAIEISMSQHYPHLSQHHKATLGSIIHNSNKELEEDER